MRRISNAILPSLVLPVLMSTLAAPCAFAYPPDNAAVLYYKASLLCRIDDEMGSALHDFRKGKIELNEKIEKLVKDNREAITTLLDACQVANCDWGINYARGFELMPPSYAGLRQLSTLIVAEAKIHARDGDYRTALDRCISLHKMASHINDRLFISHLVGISINAMAHECTAEMLSYATSDVKTLTWLKTQLAQIEGLPLPIGPAFDGEKQAGAVSITVDRMANVLEIGLGDEAFQKQVLEKVRAGDEAFFEKNRAIWNQYCSGVVTAFDLPYPQAHAKLQQLYEEVSGHPNAIFMTALAPACERVCTLSVRSKTHCNAIQTALELYLTRARTGQLPDSLPANAPRDLFSGKPFRYEKTTDGFTLHCQGKDLDKDKTYEYEFKIKK